MSESVRYLGLNEHELVLVVFLLLGVHQRRALLLRHSMRGVRRTAVKDQADTPKECFAGQVHCWHYWVGHSAVRAGLPPAWP